MKETYKITSLIFIPNMICMHFRSYLVTFEEDHHLISFRITKTLFHRGRLPCQRLPLSGRSSTESFDVLYRGVQSYQQSCHTDDTAIYYAKCRADIGTKHIPKYCAIKYAKYHTHTYTIKSAIIDSNNI